MEIDWEKRQATLDIFEHAAMGYPESRDCSLDTINSEIFRWIRNAEIRMENVEDEHSDHAASLRRNKATLESMAAQILLEELDRAVS